MVNEDQIPVSHFCVYSNSLSAWTFHPQGNERIALDLCASAEPFDSVFRKYARNVFAINPLSSRWPAVSCRFYLSQIRHQWPFYVSEKCSPTLGWGFQREPLCFYFSWCSVQEHMGGHLLGDTEWAVSLDAEDKRCHCSLLLSRTSRSYCHGTVSTALLQTKNKGLAPFFSVFNTLFCKSLEVVARYLYIRVDILNVGKLHE